MLAISAIGVVAFALFPRHVDAVFGQRPPVKASRAAQEVALRVEGMTCTGCETGIETALRRLPGVVLVDASYDDGTVTVALAPNAPLGTDELIQAVSQAGYSASPLTSMQSDQKSDTPRASVRLLIDDIKPLVDSFNADSSRIRFLAILSPT
jgi:copper chaperone CopZ